MANDNSIRFEEIMNEINELIEEAYFLLPDSSKLSAKQGWHSDILVALNNENSHLGSCDVSMERSLREIEGHTPTQDV